MGIDKDESPIKASAEQRSLARDRVRAKMAELHLSCTVESAQKIVHEFEINQIDLEMQNYELRQTSEELEISRDTYADLFDFAPVGLFTFDALGTIRTVNITGAQLLETERRLLGGKSLTGFIATADGKETFSNHLRLVLQRRVMLRCEIRLTRNDGTVIQGQLQSVAITKGKKGGHILTAITDGTVRKQLEESLRKAHDSLETAVRERTRELIGLNALLTQEIEVRKRAEESLQGTYAEINRLKDRLQAENIYLQHEVARQFNFGEIIGQSDSLKRVFLQVEQVAPMNATVLLLGETGTGKGVVARAIHCSSTRKDRPLITVDCATLPANLIESELFGREKGAFTGANVRQAGRFELANGGTIFLDEIGDLPPELQSKLLRVIQDGEFERLGSPRTIKIDVRIIAATNRNLEDEIRSGRFREDLFYRLNVFPVKMPPLRQRKEDIPLLVKHFIAKYNQKNGKKVETVSKDTLDALQEYHWPGNVRELESVIERAVITSQGTALQIVDRFDAFRKTPGPAEQNIKALGELERDHIIQVLRKTGWRINGNKGAALLLGLNPSTLRARMRKLGITCQKYDKNIIHI
ncbi:MAG TPA: sigma 54-interacting transcriptional regulator [Dongiaceae bacterium]|nr:sigma 54-interacting transcriptional regulator [Dongiaceae bacterium]